METYTTRKGQIVIPSSVRRRLGIDSGTRIQVEIDELNQRIILTPITKLYVRSLCGKHRGKGLLKSYMVEKQIEKQLEGEP